MCGPTSNKRFGNCWLVAKRKGLGFLERMEQPSVAILPWMHHPVDITRCQELPVCSVPLMERRYSSTH